MKVKITEARLNELLNKERLLATTEAVQHHYEEYKADAEKWQQLQRSGQWVVSDVTGTELHMRTRADANLGALVRQMPKNFHLTRRGEADRAWSVTDTAAAGVGGITYPIGNSPEEALRAALKDTE